MEGLGIFFRSVVICLGFVCCFLGAESGFEDLGFRENVFCGAAWPYCGMSVFSKREGHGSLMAELRVGVKSKTPLHPSRNTWLCGSLKRLRV